MRIVGICPTYRRLLVPNILAMWNRQTYKNRFLIILDDGGTYDTQSGDDWMLISVPERFPSLGGKYDSLARIACQHGDAIAIFEDDDVYLPEYLENHISVLEDFPISVPSEVYSDDKLIDGIPHVRPACRHDSKTAMHHGCWAYRSTDYLRSGGYPSGQWDFDMPFWKALSEDTDIGDPLDFGPKQYVYRWQTSGYRNGSGWGHKMHESTKTSHAEVRYKGLIAPRMDELTEKYYGMLIDQESNS